jgi:hypothetical protein
VSRNIRLDKNPPLDTIVETGTIVPCLISFLSRYENTALQIEAAWCITNIACGEARHIGSLIDAHATEALLEVITNTKSIALKDQALWAICNMTGVPRACEYALTMPNFMVLVIQTVGLECEIIHPSSGTKAHIFHTPECVLQRIVQANTKEQPTLSTMRHVTFIAGNIARYAVW